MIHSAPDTQQKLSMLSNDSRYDLACACGTGDDDRRHRADGGQRWVYPVTLPDGGRSVLFKTLMSNACGNDCRYCPLREGVDTRRCTLLPDEAARVFMSYLRAGKVFGLFLSSGVAGSPDRTMRRMNDTVRILREREGFRGYVHLKVIPGCSDEAIREAVSLASAVSLNIETAGERHFRALSEKKDYLRDIVRPMKLIGALTARGARYGRVKQTTQFVVGAGEETDRDIVRYAGRLYAGLRLNRVYFSAYQRGLGDPRLPAEQAGGPGGDALTREHRLYQVDWLLRKYGYGADEIPFGAGGKLRLDIDPKEHWAHTHPERFPVDANTAGEKELLRVPGLGPVTVGRMLGRRRQGRLRSIGDIGRPGKRLRKAERYLVF